MLPPNPLPYARPTTHPRLLIDAPKALVLSLLSIFATPVLFFILAFVLPGNCLTTFTFPPFPPLIPLLILFSPQAYSARASWRALKKIGESRGSLKGTPFALAGLLFSLAFALVGLLFFFKPDLF